MHHNHQATYPGAEEDCSWQQMLRETFWLYSPWLSYASSKSVQRELNLMTPKKGVRHASGHCQGLASALWVPQAPPVGHERANRAQHYDTRCGQQALQTFGVMMLLMSSRSRDGTVMMLSCASWIMRNALSQKHSDVMIRANCLCRVALIMTLTLAWLALIPYHAESKQSWSNSNENARSSFDDCVIKTPA